MKEHEFDCVTILGMDTGKALVEVSFMGQKIVVTSEEAKNMADVLMQTAHASEMDRAVFRFMTEELGQEVNHVALMIKSLRAFRS